MIQFNFLSSTNLLFWILIIPVALIFILLIVALVIRLVKMSKLHSVSKGVGADKEQQNEFYNAYGGIDNIVSINRELSRITVEVKEIEAVDTDRLTELGASGVLVMGNLIKASFKDRAENIYNTIKLK